MWWVSKRRKGNTRWDGVFRMQRVCLDTKAINGDITLLPWSPRNKPTSCQGWPVCFPSMPGRTKYNPWLSLACLPHPMGAHRVALPSPPSTAFFPSPICDSLPAAWPRGKETWLSCYRGQADKEQQFKSQQDILSRLLSKTWNRRKGRGK